LRFGVVEGTEIELGKKLIKKATSRTEIAGWRREDMKWLHRSRTSEFLRSVNVYLLFWLGIEEDVTITMKICSSDLILLSRRAFQRGEWDDLPQSLSISTKSLDPNAVDSRAS
jgi:hypothetical protein